MKLYRLTKFHILLLICTLAFLLRFNQLGRIPFSIDWDEASNAYNAYSILKTARDEYGKLLPLFNRSFDDYKPPAYMYLEVPAVSVFGLTQFAARLPSAIVGVLTILAIYYFVKMLLGIEKLALFSAFFLSISPWHVQFSRVGFEANIGFFAMIFALTLFIKGLTQNPKNSKNLLYFSALALGLCAYTYHSQRILVPILLLSAILIYKKQFMALPKKSISIFVLILIISIVPLFVFAPKEALLGRLQSTSSKDQQAIEQKVSLFQKVDKNSRVYFSGIFSTKKILMIKSYFQNYIENFSSNFLFVRGDGILRHHIGGMGMLYLFEMPLVIFGLYLFGKKRSPGALFLLIWLLASPLPAAASSETPHAIRSMALLTPISVAAAWAIYELSLSANWRKISYLLILPVLTISAFLYLENYYRHYPWDSAPSWQYGYLQAGAETEKLKGSYQKIIIDSTIEEGYIFWLFQTKYDPKVYQREGNRGHFDKYYFGNELPKDPKELTVSTKLPDNFEIIDTIYYPSGKPAVQIGHPK